MSTDLDRPERPRPEGAGVALLVYILYFCGFATAITTVAGLIVAYVQRGEAAPEVRSHLTFQIRTFWIGCLIAFVSTLLAIVLIGWLGLLFWLVWTLTRCISGVLKLNRDEPVADELSWGFTA
ncbi:MAG: DUF4870 domain-containing protein [Pseudomonadota bacterium]